MGSLKAPYICFNPMYFPFRILFTGGSAEEEVLLETGLGRAAMHFYNNSIKVRLREEIDRK